MDAAPAEERLQWVDVVAHGIEPNGRAWVTIPACPSGRRGGEPQPVDTLVDDVDQRLPDAGILLEHAGHHAFAWSAERVGAPSDVPLTTGARRPRPLTDAEWDILVDDFAKAAQLGIARQKPLGVVLDDDTLWHAHLSPRLHPGRTTETREERVLHLVERLLALQPNVVVATCVDDLCPGGLDPLGGQRWVQRLVDAGVRKLWLSTGSSAMPLLAERHVRVDGGVSQQHQALLAPVVRAAKLVDAEVWAVGPFAGTLPSVPSPLAGVVRWMRNRQS